MEQDLTNLQNAVLSEGQEAILQKQIEAGSAWPADEQERLEDKMFKVVDEGRLAFGERVAPVACPQCHTPGWLYLADFETQDAYVIHIWKNRKRLQLSPCHLGKIKKPLFSITTQATEGVLMPIAGKPVKVKDLVGKKLNILAVKEIERLPFVPE